MISVKTGQSGLLARAIDGPLELEFIPTFSPGRRNLAVAYTMNDGVPCRMGFWHSGSDVRSA